MKRISIATCILFILCAFAYAQNGGKAEAKRIVFRAGASETILTGSLKNGEEMEFVFTARKDQKITLRNAATSMFDVRVFNTDYGIETEFDSSREFSVTLPETGDYMLFVRRKMVRRPARSRFTVSVRIR
jgi:hypothetical protein